MLQIFGQAQVLVLFVLAAAGFVVKAYAFIDALRHSAAVYTAAGKLSRNAWLGITGAALAIGFVLVTAPLNFLNLIGVVAALIYLVDVRPALRQVRGGGSPGSRMGPYGPW